MLRGSFSKVSVYKEVDVRLSLVVRRPSSDTEEATASHRVLEPTQTRSRTGLIMDEEYQHAHCVTCFSRRCMTRPETGVSCDLIGCPHVCGAVFHSCKAEEHRLLCPLERVPCLNNGSGCPFVMVRNKLADHLQICPASVVCCTMEWNRWPVSYADRKSYENLSRDVDEVEQLDMALALQDQRMLLESLRVATMMSKTTEKPESQEQLSAKEEEGKILINGVSSDEDSYSALYQATVETTKTLAAALDILNNATRDIAILNGRLRDASCEMNKNFQLSEQNGKNYILMDMELEDEESIEAATGMACSSLKAIHQNGSSDFYPGTNGSYVVGNGDLEMSQASVLCNGFHDFTVAPKGEVFTVGSQNGAVVALESGGNLVNQCSNLPCDRQLSDPCITSGSEEKVLDKKDEQGLRNVAVFGRRPFLVDTYWFKMNRMENKAVDTSDLELQEDPMGLNSIDLVTAALLFCLGDSPGGRGISDSRNVDGYHVDFGTQTFSFPSAILATNTMVGDIASASACDHANPQLSNPSPFQTLGLDLVLECVARYQAKQRSMFTFVCGQLFRRDEFSSHFKNVHGDIHAGLNGWMEQRCPLAYYGCTYSQRRFCPSTQGSKIIHDRHLKSFGVQPHLSSDIESVKSSSLGPSEDNFSSLPYEVLQHIAGFLDGFTLCQLSRVSRHMRDVCASLLQSRGMVVLLWEKRQYPHGSSWQIKEKVWRFSTAFCTVKEWKFADIVSMADHLKKCTYNTVEKREDAVPLPCMCVTRELTKDGRSLRSVLRPVL